jgi:hypothetical protein
VTTLYRSRTHAQTSVLGLLVSTNCFLETNFNTGTIIVSLNHTLQISHIKFSLYSHTLAANSFLHSLLYRTEFSIDNCLGHPNCLQDNSSAHSMQKTQPLYCCWGFFTMPLHRNGHGIDHIENTILLLLCACMLRALPSQLLLSTESLLSNGSIHHNILIQIIKGLLYRLMIWNNLLDFHSHTLIWPTNWYKS